MELKGTKVLYRKYGYCPLDTVPKDYVRALTDVTKCAMLRVKVKKGGKDGRKYKEAQEGLEDVARRDGGQTWCLNNDY